MLVVYDGQQVLLLVVGGGEDVDRPLGDGEGEKGGVDVQRPRAVERRAVADQQAVAVDRLEKIRNMTVSLPRRA